MFEYVCILVPSYDMLITRSRPPPPLPLRRLCDTGHRPAPCERPLLSAAGCRREGLPHPHAAPARMGHWVCLGCAGASRAMASGEAALPAGSAGPGPGPARGGLTQPLSLPTFSLRPSLLPLRHPHPHPHAPPFPPPPPPPPPANRQPRARHPHPGARPGPARPGRAAGVRCCRAAYAAGVCRHGPML